MRRPPLPRHVRAVVTLVAAAALYGIGCQAPAPSAPSAERQEPPPPTSAASRVGPSARDADQDRDRVEPGAPETTSQPAPVNASPSGGTGASTVAAAPASTPDPAPILRPPADHTWDIAESPGHEALDDGARRARSGDWAGARRALSAGIKRLTDGDIEASVAGHALLGRACDRLGDAKCAGAAFAKVQELGKGLEAPMKELVAAGGDAAMKRATRALLAQGEALFYVAEQKRKAADAIKFPPYHGSGARDDVLKHINVKVTDWIKKRRPAIDEAERAYAAVLKLQPAAPPRWIAASGERVGDMWSAFVNEFRTGPPIPTEWTKKGKVPGSDDLTYEEVLKEFKAKLDEASEPQRQLAVSAYKSCRDIAKKYGLPGGEGKRCEDRLSALGAAP